MTDGKCSACGKQMGMGSDCSKCEAYRWDQSFESTSEHAYEIGFKDLVDKITVPCTDESKKAIAEIMGEWGPLEWACEKCKTVHVKKDASASKEQKEDVICKGCSCGGRIVPKPPKKYF